MILRTRSRGIGYSPHPLKLSCQATAYCFLLCAIAGGCDRIVWGTQTIALTVERAEVGTPVADANITFAPEDRKGPSSLYDLSTEDYLEKFRNEDQVTNASGRLVLSEQIVLVRGGIWVWLRLDRLKLEDSITGHTYIFRIEKDVDETLAIKMAPGISVQGKHFKLLIDVIGDPVPR